MKATFLNNRFSPFSFLALLIVLLLSVSQILLEPKPVHSQSKDTERMGNATLVWKMTVTGTSQQIEDRSSNNLKNVTEITENITVITEGSFKFKIDQDGNHRTNEEMTTSVSGTGGTITKHYYELKETCGFPTKLGIGKYEDTFERFYIIKDNPKACHWAAYIYPKILLDKKEIYYQLQDERGAEPWLAAQYTIGNKQYDVHTNPCGEVDNWRNDDFYYGDTDTIPDNAAGKALAFCLQDEAFVKQIQGYFPKNQNDFYTVSNTAFYEWTDSGVLTAPNGKFSAKGTVKLEYTLTYENNPLGLEVVIIPPDDYAKWIPESGKNEATQGNGIGVSADLRVKGSPDLSPLEKAKFIFELVDTSHEKGVCLNVPKEADPANPPDMKFDPKENPNFTITNDGQTATSKKSDISAHINISSFDWGGRTRLQVTAITDKDKKKLIGHVVNGVERELLIPEDKNNNLIADAWEKEKNIFEKNLPSEWNDIDLPSGQEAPGDGISFYERYRGFEFESTYNPTNPKLKHERLKPDRKYVFIYDPADIVLSTAVNPVSRDMNFIQISGFVVRFLAEDQWSGSGLFSDHMRIVNFNYGTAHIVDQHGLEIHANSKSEIIDPISGIKEPNSSEKITLGIAWDDNSSPRPFQDSPANVHLIEIFTSNIDDYLNDLLIYHTLGMPKFEGKDYKDMTADEQKQVEVEATKYYQTHKNEYNQVFLKLKARTTSHELGHGLGVHHHKPTKAGSKECVMRYFEDLVEKDPNDRFELRNRVWPDNYCTKTENTWNNKGCRLQIKATDKGKK